MQRPQLTAIESKLTKAVHVPDEQLWLELQDEFETEFIAQEMSHRDRSYKNEMNESYWQ